MLRLSTKLWFFGWPLYFPRIQWPAEAITFTNPIVGANAVTGESGLENHLPSLSLRPFEN